MQQPAPSGLKEAGLNKPKPPQEKAKVSGTDLLGLLDKLDPEPRKNSGKAAEKAPVAAASASPSAKSSAPASSSTSARSGVDLGKTSNGSTGKSSSAAPGNLSVPATTVASTNSASTATPTTPTSGSGAGADKKSTRSAQPLDCKRKRERAQAPSPSCKLYLQRLQAQAYARTKGMVGKNRTASNQSSTVSTREWTNSTMKFSPPTRACCHHKRCRSLNHQIHGVSEIDQGTESGA